jgi:hypothetical protein
MKKTTTILAVLLCCITYAQIPNYIPTNGLIGYWPFTGNANDESGNNLNGTVTGATLTTDRNNSANSAYSFTYQGWNPGTQLTEVYIPYNPILNTNYLTVSCWIYPTAYGYGYPTGSGASIIKRFQYGYSNPNGETWEFQFLPNGDLVGTISDASTTQTQNTAIVTANALPLNVWSHVLMRYDGSSLSLWVNGTQVGDTAATLALNTLGNSGISVGVSDQANGWWDPYQGKIDDIGIWNRALTQQEITNLYSSSADTTSPCTVYDTITVYDTTSIMVYDTTHITVYDTTHVTVYDTTHVSLSTTDTLIIDVATGIAPPNNTNTLKVYPNPAKDHLVINNGNLAAMAGYSVKITNALGQVVFNQPVNQQQFYIDLSSWGGSGTYFLYVIDAQQTVKETKEIVLQYPPSLVQQPHKQPKPSNKGMASVVYR